MSLERFPPDDPKEWLNRARSNLASARGGINIPDVYLEDLCFDAQQAAEKAIKALLIHLEVRFPYIHDLGQLLALVEQAGRTVPEQVKEAARLSLIFCPKTGGVHLPRGSAYPRISPKNKGFALS